MATPDSRRLLMLAHLGSRAPDWGFDFIYSADERFRNGSISLLMQSMSFTGGDAPCSSAGQGREHGAGLLDRKGAVSILLSAGASSSLRGAGVCSPSEHRLA